MKLVILAGGRGSRISEESILKPKPLIEIGGMPIIWHIMKIYSSYGIKDFIICCGYKGYLIKEYFSNFFLHSSDVTINLKKNSIKIHKKNSEDWNITLINTGEDTATGGRILKIKKYVDNTFCLTYGDGLSNINIKELINQHKKSKKAATMSVVLPSARFGAVEIDTNKKIKKFVEKPKGDKQWVNGGFFVLNKKIFNYLSNSNTVWEKEPLENLARDNELMSFKHEGFWQPMDTLRDKLLLDKLWNENKAKWKIW
jgi:glucose-1-phosphate cytidylyltransferase